MVFGAIRKSSYPQQALRLMTLRLQERDFQVSTGLLEWLASSERRMEVPDAFQCSKPAADHDQAVEKLRKYVRLVAIGRCRALSAVPVVHPKVVEVSNE